MVINISVHDITRDINRRTDIAWGCFTKFSTELFDRPSAPLSLKARLLKAEAMEALMYGCMPWAPRNAYYRQLRTTHHKLLLRVIGYRHVHGTCRQMSYTKARKPGAEVWKRPFTSDGFCSQGPWPDRVTRDVVR